MCLEDGDSADDVPALVVVIVAEMIDRIVADVAPWLEWQMGDAVFFSLPFS